MANCIQLFSGWRFGCLIRIMGRVRWLWSFIGIWNRSSIRTFKPFPFCYITVVCLIVHNGFVFVGTIQLVGWTTRMTRKSPLFRWVAEMVRCIHPLLQKTREDHIKWRGWSPVLILPTTSLQIPLTRLESSESNQIGGMLTARYIIEETENHRSCSCICQ